MNSIQALISDEAFGASPLSAPSSTSSFPEAGLWGRDLGRSCGSHHPGMRSKMRDVHQDEGCVAGCGSERGGRAASLPSPGQPASIASQPWGTPAAPARSWGLKALPAAVLDCSIPASAAGLGRWRAGARFPRPRPEQEERREPEREGRRVCRVLCFGLASGEHRSEIGFCIYTYLFIHMGKLIYMAQVMRASETRLHSKPESVVCLSL